MMRAITRILTAITFASALSSCFTGVESTPRISNSDVRKQQAATVSDEKLFLSDIHPAAPSAWKPGDYLLKVDDARIGRTLTAASAPADCLVGHVVAYQGRRPAISLTGEDATELIFRDEAQREYFYRVAVASADFDTLSRLDIPYTVDLATVATADSLMRGRRLYISTPNWYDATGVAVRGLRHIEVIIDSVIPATSLYPAAVFFSVADPAMAVRAGVAGDDLRRMVLMSVAGAGASTRSFDKLFAFENPRRRYSSIEDDVWDLIIASRVREGMTRDECRLALGAPPSITRIPTRGGMRETWSYSDGIYLVFDDEFLTRFRL